MQITQQQHTVSATFTRCVNAIYTYIYINVFMNIFICISVCLKLNSRKQQICKSA